MKFFIWQDRLANLGWMNMVTIAFEMDTLNLMYSFAVLLQWQRTLPIQMWKDNHFHPDWQEEQQNSIQFSVLQPMHCLIYIKIYHHSWVQVWINVSSIVFGVVYSTSMSDLAWFTDDEAMGAILKPLLGLCPRSFIT